MTAARVLPVWLNVYNKQGALDETNAMVRAFEERHPEFRVEVSGFDFHELAQEVLDAAQSGRQPAIAEIYMTGVQEALDMRTTDGRPLFTSVEQAVAGRSHVLGEPVVLDDLLPAVADYYRVDGALPSLPLRASTAILYGNQAILQAAGVDQMPQTWTEFEAACAAVRALPDGPEYAACWPNHGWMFQQQAAQTGVPMTDRDNGRSGRARRVDLATPELVEYVHWWKSLQDAGHYFYTGDIDPVSCWWGNFRAFVEQRVAFTISSSVVTGYLAPAAEKAGFSITAGRLPYDDRLPYAGNVLGGDSLWLASGLDPELQDGALALMQFLASTDNAARRHRGSFYSPVNLSAIDLLEGEGWFAEYPYHRVAIEQLSASDRSPGALGAICPEFSGMQKAMTEAMHDVLTAGADPHQALSAATSHAQSLLDGYTDLVTGGATPRPPKTVWLS